MSEAIAVRLVSSTCGANRVGMLLGRKGNGYLINRMTSFRSMAQREPVLVITDLDRSDCPATLIHSWSNGEQSPENLLLRVAVREAESWVLADRHGAADLLGISPHRIPLNPEDIGDPKQFLLNLARTARREVRSELIAQNRAIASQGLGYNRVLSEFVELHWDLESAVQRSVSLNRAVIRLEELSQRLHH